MTYRKLILILLSATALGGCGGKAAMHSTLKTETGRLEEQTAIAKEEKTLTPLPEVRWTQSKPGKVTLTGIVVDLLDHNPDVAIANAKEKEQLFGIKVAEAASKPTMDVNVSGGPQRVFIPSSAGDSFRREVAATVKQTLYDFGATKNDIQRARSAYESASSARVAKTESVAESVVEAYLDVKKADELMAVTKRSIDAHQSILALVKLTAENGSGTVADVKRITSRLENAKTDLIDLTTSRSDAVDTFRNLTDFDVDQVDGSGIDRLGGKISGLDDATLEANPLMLSIDQEIDSLKYQLASVKAGKMPVIGFQGVVKGSLNVNSSANTDEQFSSYALATLRVPLLDGGLNDGQLGQIQNRLEAAMLRLEKQRRDLRQQADSVMRLSDSGGNKSGSLATRVAAARKVADLCFEQFKSGGKSLFELLDAQSEYYKAEGEMVRQKFERTKSQIIALQLKGKLVDSIVALHPDEPKLARPVSPDMQQTSSVPKPAQMTAATAPATAVAAPTAAKVITTPTTVTTTISSASNQPTFDGGLPGVHLPPRL